MHTNSALYPRRAGAASRPTKYLIRVLFRTPVLFFIAKTGMSVLYSKCTRYGWFSLFLNLHGGRIRRPLLMSRAQRGGVLHAGSFFPSQQNTKTHLEQSDFCCHFALSAQRQRVVAAMFRCFRPPCCALFRKCAIGWPRTHQKERPRARRYAPPPPAEASLCRGLAIPRKAAPSLCNRFAA